MSWFFSFRGRANALFVKAGLSNKAADYRMAINAFARLSEETSSQLQHMDRAASYLDLGRLNLALCEVTRMPEDGQAALHAFKQCRTFFDPVEYPDLNKSVSNLEVLAEDLVRRLSKR